jgi:hypothetical protein
MFSLGKVPYPGIEAGEALFDKIFSGYRMEKPDSCPINVYKVLNILIYICNAGKCDFRIRFAV